VSQVGAVVAGYVEVGRVPRVLEMSEERDLDFVHFSSVCDETTTLTGLGRWRKLWLLRS
jgi:hypothetical protein